jgi:hypothetical protein
MFSKIIPLDMASKNTPLYPHKAVHIFKQSPGIHLSHIEQRHDNVLIPIAFSEQIIVDTQEGVHRNEGKRRTAQFVILREHLCIFALSQASKARGKKEREKLGKESNASINLNGQSKKVSNLYS